MQKVQTIGMRELTRNAKNISESVQKGKSFIVLKNAMPVFRIEPLLDQEKVPKTYTLADMKHLQFHSREKNISKNIDKIVYGL